MKTTMLVSLAAIVLLPDRLIVVAAPVSEPVVRPVYELDPDNLSLFGWFSHVNDTIFGEDASDYDYRLGSDDPSGLIAAADSMEAYSAACATGDVMAIAVSFLNASTFGSVTVEEAADRDWLCRELNDDMAAEVGFCDGVYRASIPWEAVLST
ncbi:hypothetical protein K431DRAFT_296092 [Polychaeton citri CBS 116435]|uniref:Uncharacterized protein n=1 Tax=Polychaeton citri CBS 116435 TaxID=1314669 RepID=A0A9P4UNV1_9PEZI|nr:hypothetical protein K431DRAFT_296092 [Polychaeton citri CBS 116435]